jgi:hypothetical protein
MRLSPDTKRDYTRRYCCTPRGHTRKLPRTSSTGGLSKLRHPRPSDPALDQPYNPQGGPTISSSSVSFGGGNLGGGNLGAFSSRQCTLRLLLFQLGVRERFEFDKR